MRFSFDPFRDLDVLRREIDRAFDGLGLPVFQSNPNRNAFLPGRHNRRYPLVNVSENQDGFTVEALMPGVDPESLNINVLKDQVTISGEKTATIHPTAKPENYHRNERAHGKFTRSFNLSTEIDPDNVKAEYHNGILLLKLPKSAKARPRQIAVTVA